MNRRGFLAATAATGALAATGRPAWAKSTRMLGTKTIQTVSDGNLTLPADFIFGSMDRAKLAPILAENGVEVGAPLTPPCNLTLIRDEDRVILFDAGSGPGFQDSAGEVVDALDALELDVSDITHVVFTHGHPDHLWGVLDDFDDPLFYEAEHMIGKTEWEYWLADSTVNTIGDARASFAVGAKRRLEAIEDQISFFEDGEEILPGIAAHLTPGHTPGHTAFEIQGGSEGLMILGDSIGNHHVAFARPDWEAGSDQDPETAAATRSKLIERLAAEKMALIGFHLPGGGIGRAEKAETGYRFVQD